MVNLISNCEEKYTVQIWYRNNFSNVKATSVTVVNFYIQFSFLPLVSAISCNKVLIISSFNFKKKQLTDKSDNYYKSIVLKI